MKAVAIRVGDRIDRLHCCSKVGNDRVLVIARVELGQLVRTIQPGLDGQRLLIQTGVGHGLKVHSERMQSRAGEHAEVDAVILAGEDDFLFRVIDDEVVHPDLRIVVSDAFSLAPWPTEGGRGPVEARDAANARTFFECALALIEHTLIEVQDAQEAPIFHLHRVLHSQWRFSPVNHPALQHQGMCREESAHALGRLWVAGDMDP